MEFMLLISVGWSDDWNFFVDFKIIIIMFGFYLNDLNYRFIF